MSDPGFQGMLEQTKQRTYSYAKYQLKWIRKQFLPAIAAARSLDGDVEIFVIRGGDQDTEIAIRILHGKVYVILTICPDFSLAFLRGEALPDSKLTGSSEAADLLSHLDNLHSGIIVPTTAEYVVDIVYGFNTDLHLV